MLEDTPATSFSGALIVQLLLVITAGIITGDTHPVQFAL